MSKKSFSIGDVVTGFIVIFLRINIRFNYTLLGSDYQQMMLMSKKSFSIGDVVTGFIVNFLRVNTTLLHSVD
ncbi:hypothetical protein [Chryseobacterium sp. Leaf405]|uniref:hypothetical protein n=1 Tax=Chryseobacterium sp. Leaf405 TaxID=1736367 RepID=UPI00103F8ACB|nr:hypothetical protein [Chryseobacterium sp. Leaf405]